MNTVGDIWELQSTGVIILNRTGFVVTEITKQFSARMQQLIARSYYLLCVDKKEQSDLTESQLPPLEEMITAVGKLDHSIKLPQFAQSAYYCAIAVLLTMDGHSEEAMAAQYLRADMLMNSGVLPN